MISIRELLDEGIAAQRHEHTEPPTTFWASSIGSCLRKQVLKRRGVEGEPFDQRSLRVFAVGDALHDWAKATAEAGAIAKGAVIVGHEVPIYDENYEVSGKIDTLWIQPDGTPEAVEWKTINSQAFHYRDLPYLSHVAQMVTYLRFYKSPLQLARADDLADLAKYRELRDLLPTKLTRGRLVYLSKDDALVEEHVVDLTPEIEERLEDRLAELQNWLGEEDLPPRLDMRPDKRKDGSDFVYLVGPKKGQTKMVFDPECHRGGGSTIRCPYFTQCFPQNAQEPTDEPDPKRNDSAEVTLPL